MLTVSRGGRFLQPPRLLIVVSASLLLAFSATGCGGDADQQRLQAEQIERAREEGRREAIAEQRAKEASKEAARLRREIEKLKDRKTDSAPTATGGASQAPSAASSGATPSGCAEGLSVNAVTSCSFARNVRESYDESGGAASIEVYSPVTKEVYTMKCSGGVPVVCTGGNGAAVYIR